MITDTPNTGFAEWAKYLQDLERRMAAESGNFDSIV